MKYSFKKLHQSQDLRNAISLSNIGQKIMSWSILSEIMPTFSIVTSENSQTVNYKLCKL